MWIVTGTVLICGSMWGNQNSGTHQVRTQDYGVYADWSALREPAKDPILVHGIRELVKIHVREGQVVLDGPHLRWPSAEAETSCSGWRPSYSGSLTHWT